MKQIILPNSLDYSDICIDGIITEEVIKVISFFTDNGCETQITPLKEGKYAIKLLNSQFIPAKYSHSEMIFDFIILLVFTKEEWKDIQKAEDLNLEVINEMLYGATSKEALREWDID